MHKQRVSPITDRDIFEKLNELEEKINKISANICLYALCSFGFALGAFSLALFAFEEEIIFLFFAFMGVIMMITSIFGMNRRDKK